MLLKATNLRKNFGSQEALADVSFEIGPGEFFGLLGPNGAGKTTTIRILSTLMLPTSGEVTVDGELLKRNRVDLKKKITVVTQDYTLRNDMTIEQVLELQGRLYRVPRKERKQRIASLLQRMELTEHKGKLIRNLSGGMKRKVMLCRALLPQPELILLDEPTVGLDPIFRQQMWQLLKELNSEGISFLLTTHYLEEAQQLCKQVAFLDGGRIIASGTPQTVMKDFGSYCVEDGAARQLFHSREDAIAHLRGCPDTAKLRETNLEDIFFHLAGKKEDA